MKFNTKVIEKRTLNDNIIILKLERHQFEFKAGQYVVLSFPGEKEAREYSIYSGENDNFIEILLKSVPEGSFSKRLSELEKGDEIVVDGPYGFFVMKNKEVERKKHTFIATGTGISPFRSYINTFPNLRYQLLHGIGVLNERIEPENYATDKIIYCVSRELTRHFKGRVTDYLASQNIEKDTVYHLCGNSEMINDAIDILEKNGVLPENIRTEVFY